MHETMEKAKKACEMRCLLEDYIYPKLACPEKVMSVEHGGEFIDMIKDLSEVEKNFWEACYYKKMSQGMEPMMYSDMEENERMGYDNWRYSSGQFAPKGRGHRSGYMPMDDQYNMGKEPFAPMFMDKMMRNGYDGMGRTDGRYGRAYNDWKQSRRGYSSTHSEADKKEMDSHAKEHISDMLVTFNEIWGDAEPELRKKMLTDFLGAFRSMSRTGDADTKKKLKADLTTMLAELG